ncbi:MAG: 3-hydroxyisobutyrate dehydrogenase [Mycobacterium sp.]|jgi:3-hydroxyisobutyrate dehydrogenase|uniref:NAD(P)-dependent oxidoreductase n=1 Tax=Mycobacterium sp. TaxID=1785 RepID=UPI0028BBE89B|nr:NAD(P)-dependent oxidoreductase [Mycobacterium sp.]MDT5120488.1 3-hydroxyisobutyrate dehydrogenase [Mycobacterium sp.]
MADHVRRVAVLGTGTMGAPMARNLLHAGFGVRVWNRTMAKAAALAADGAHPASDPAEAATGADVLITMLTDGATVEGVMTGPDGALSMLRSNAMWIQMSTVGVEWTDQFADLADRHGVAFVDAPVSGSSEPAGRGELEILAAGALEVRPRVQPIFDVLGRRTVWLDHVGDGSRLKLALNNWLVVLVEAMSETLTFSQALGLEPHLFLETIAGGPLASAYAMTKGTAMLDEDFVPGFPLRHAVKDAELATSAARRHGAELALTDALLPRWREAVVEGHGDEDVAAAVTQSAAALRRAVRA